MLSVSSSTAEMAEQVKMSQVEEIYQNLLNQDFNGIHEGSFQMHEKEWEKIQVDQADPIMDKLREVQGQVQGKIWKGFTGEKDGYRFTDYCLYVELQPRNEPDRKPTRFKIVSVQPFPVTNETHKYTSQLGARMEVKVVEEQKVA
jgi:hypothetical protein